MNANKRECLSQAFAFFHVMEQAKSAFHYVAGIFLRGMFVVMPLGFSHRSELAKPSWNECCYQAKFVFASCFKSSTKLSSNRQKLYSRELAILLDLS